MAATQNRKKKYLKRAQIDIPESVSLIPIDFNKEKLKNVLEKAGYDSNQKTFLEQRGLKIVNHLDNEEIERTFLLNENGSLIGQITGSFRFAMASPFNKNAT